MPQRNLTQQVLHAVSRFLRHSRAEPPCGELEVCMRDGTGVGMTIRGAYDPHSDPAPADGHDTIRPTAAGNDYNRCARDVEAVLRAAAHPLKLQEIVAALESAGHSWSDRHVRRALTLLRGNKKVTWRRADGYRFTGPSA